MAVADTRKTILDTASDLFYAKGYNLIGINEIIAKSGIAKATLYSHFSSKEEILLAYLEKMDRDLMNSLQDFVQTKRKGDAKLLAVLQFLQTFFDQQNFNGCWCIRSLAEVPRDNELVRKKIKDNKNRLLNYLKLLVLENKPDYQPKQQDSLARQLYLLYESAVTESHLQQDDWPITSAIDILKLRLKSKH